MRTSFCPFVFKILTEFPEWNNIFSFTPCWASRINSGILCVLIPTSEHPNSRQVFLQWNNSVSFVWCANLPPCIHIKHRLKWASYFAAQVPLLFKNCRDIRRLWQVNWILGIRKRRIQLFHLRCHVPWQLICLVLRSETRITIFGSLSRLKIHVQTSLPQFLGHITKSQSIHIKLYIFITRKSSSSFWVKWSCAALCISMEMTRALPNKEFEKQCEKNNENWVGPTFFKSQSGGFLILNSLWRMTYRRRTQRGQGWQFSAPPEEVLESLERLMLILREPGQILQWPALFFKQKISVNCSWCDLNDQPKENVREQALASEQSLKFCLFSITDCILIFVNTR